MKIIITEQQFNLILLGEGRGGYNKLSPEEVKQKYDEYVEKYNKLWDGKKEIISSHIPNSNPPKVNPDYAWLTRHGKLDDFYKETFYYKRKELLKDKEYKRLVKKYNKLWGKKREIISIHIPNTNPKKKNPDYRWLNDNGKWEEFKIATNYEERVKEMGGMKRNILIKKYGFIPQNATPEEVINYLEKKGIGVWGDFSKTYLYDEIPDDVREEVKKKYNTGYLKYGFSPQEAEPKIIANYILKNYNSWMVFNRNDRNLYNILRSARKILDDVLKLLPGDFKTGKSAGEGIIKTILSELNIKDYIYDKSVFDCKSEKGCTLRPDFQLPNYGGTENNKGVEVWVEYDGIQHFIPNKRFGCIEGLKMLIKNDITKNQYCSGKIIKMIRISYKTKKYEEIKDEIIRGLASNEKIYLSKDYPKLGWNDPRLKDDPEMNYLYEYECN